MSQSSNNRIKDAGRKPYNSLNVNHTFKPVKGETKSAAGQNVRHGLQVLGKVGLRRTPAPTNLPSLKSENSGNDPSINLVPSGQGWVKKENVAAAVKKGDKPPPVSVPVQAKPPPAKPIDTQEISLRPNAGAVPGIKPPPPLPPPGGTGSTSESGKMTWGDKVQQRQPALGSSMYFHREFPKLGGDAKGGGGDVKEGDRQEENAPDASPQAMGHPEFMGGQKWMDSPGGRMQVPMNMPPFTGERPMFNGAQMQYPYIYPIYPTTHGGRMMPPYPYPYYPGNKMQPMDPRMMDRMAKGQMMGMPIPPTERPSVVKDSELRSLDEHKEDADNGWAGTHEEVDYSAKLQFDESDDSEDDVPPLNSKKGDTPRAHADHGKDENKNPPENWNEYAQGYSQQMMMAFVNQHWNRPPFPGYDPQRGPPPGAHAFPFHGMYPPHPMFLQQNMAPQSAESSEEQRKSGEKADAKEDHRVDEKDKKELERRARLKRVEEGMKKREEEKRMESVEIMKKQVSADDDPPEIQRLDRSRNNSEASDSSRRSTANDIAPRFRRQISNHDPLSIGDVEVGDNRSGSESPHLTIMKRKDSIKSEDSLPKEDIFKKLDTPSEKGSQENINERCSFDKLSDQRASRHSSSSSLYKETIKSERQKRYSSSSDTHDKERPSLHGSSSSIHKDNEKKEHHHEREKGFTKKELKDLSETRLKDSSKSKGREKLKKIVAAEDEEDSRSKGSDLHGRFEKLTKGQTKTVLAVKEDSSVESKKKDEPTKTSPWSNVVSGKPPSASKPDKTNKSLRDIQLEEEEELNRKLKKGDIDKSSVIEGVPGDDVYDKHNEQRNRRMMPPDESRFRSDGYDNRPTRHPPPPYMGDDKYENRFERRGRFANKRPPNEDGYRQNYNRYKDNDGREGGREDGRFGKGDGWNPQQQRRGEFNNNRRDEYNRNDRKDFNKPDYNRNDRRDDHKNERRDDYKTDRKDEHRGDRRDDHKGDRRDDHKPDRRDDHKNDRRDDHKGGRDDSRSEKKDHRGDRRDDHRNDRRNERRDDHKNERKDEHSQEKKDNYRKDDRRHKDYNKDESNERRDERSVDGKKEDFEKDDRGKNERRDEHKRYDKRENSRRDFNKKENYRKNEGVKEERRDEKKNNFREDRKRDDNRVGRRDVGRPESGRRYPQESREYSEEDRPYETRRKKDEWSNRDYRQSEEYQKLVEEKESKKAEEALAKEAVTEETTVSNEGVDTELKTDDGNGPNEMEEDSPSLKPMAEDTQTTNIIKETPVEDVRTEPTMPVEPTSYCEVVSGESASNANPKLSAELCEEMSQLEVGEKGAEGSKNDIEIIDLTKEVEELQVGETKDDNMARMEDVLPAPVQEQQAETAGNDVKPVDASIVTDDDGKPKGGFGVPGRPHKKSNRSDYSNNYRSDSYSRGESGYRGGDARDSRDSNYRGDPNYRNDGNYRGRERGRGRGRGGSYSRGRGESTRGDSSRGRRPSGGGRYRGGSGAPRDDSRRRKDDDYYEDISPGELTDSEAEEKKPKPISHEMKEGSSRKQNQQPPRFQRQSDRYDSQERGRGRGRGFNRSSERGRGSMRERGRGRGRGRGTGSSHSVPSTHTTSTAISETKDTEEGDSDAWFSADENILSEDKDDPNLEKATAAPQVVDRDAKPRTRGAGRGSLRGGRGTGATRGSRGSKNGSFLVNRQQVGNKRSSSKSEKTLSAADKSDMSTDVVVNGKAESHSRNQMNLEDISTHSPPKKSKNQIEKREDRKREIYKEFDLNNIASVVCIDNMKVGVEQVGNISLEDEGFVTVTSKKQQKEKREREREELKKKMLLEQKQESTANKAPKPARNGPKGTSANNVVKVKPVAFTEAPISSPTADQIHTTTAAVSSPVSQQPSNNVAMAAFGVWEPAQSLMRTSQQSNSSGNDMIKTSLSGTISTSINAWQRPLSLSASTDMSLPDPRAVGTGKPSSSHASLMNKSSQPAPETSSLVTPPVLAPIGTSNLNSTAPIGTSNLNSTAPIGTANLNSTAPIGTTNLNGTVPMNSNAPIGPGNLISTSNSISANGISTDITVPVIAPDERLPEPLSETNTKKDEPVEIEFDHEPLQGDPKPNEKREKPRKMTKTEKAPRFQTRKDSDDRGKGDDGRKPRPNRPSSGEKNTQKRSIDRPRKSDVVKSGQDKKPIRAKDVDKQVDDNSPIVFINDITPVDNNVDKGTPKSTLSDADKVVGSNKPSLKSQSSLGSYSSSVDTNIEEPIIEVNVPETFQPPVENEISVESEEQKVDGSRRSAIDTLNDDEERSLETRSLPGTPPLAVKIPEPLPPGPSSDPGRGPSPPNLDKGIAPSIAQEMNKEMKEMNEMNRRLLNARRAWEDTPTTWSSETAAVSSAVSSDVVTVAPVESVAPQAIIDESNIPGSPTKSESSVPPTIEVRQKSTEEKVSASGGVFSSKRTEQQVCKVKPQQQLPSEEVKSYQTAARTPQLTAQRTNTNQKYASYGIPMERSFPQNTSTLYTPESVYGGEQQMRSQNNQALNFQSLAPTRSMSTSVSPHSQQRDMMLSSLQVGNMYSANTLQVSQSQFLAWQVTPTVQPTKTVPYQTYTQGSSFTSPVSIAGNSPVIMQYGTTNFAPQRSTSNIQRQHVSMLQMQQPQPAQGGRLVGLMPSRGGQHVRRNQQYQALQSTSDGRVVNPNQMALMLEPNAPANMNHPQQMSGQQRSDLMKHVHAKPFEPTSQTPPLMQSPPVVAQQSLPPQQHQMQQQQSPQQQQQQHIAPSVFSQPASITHQHVPNMNNYSQPIVQQRQHSVQHIQHQTPLVASVRPRSIQEQNLSSVSSSMPNQDRVNNISPFNPFLASNVNYKGRSSRGNLQVAVPQQAISNQFPQHALQTQNHGPSRSPTVALGMMSGPGPIQRPQVHQQPTLTHKPYVLDAVIATDGAFKQTQRQKMLEDTKKYFEEEQKILSEVEKTTEEKPVSSVAPTLAKHDLSKHDKVVLPNSKENGNGKKFEYKKNVRNTQNGDFNKTRAAPKRVQTKGTGTSTKKPSEATASQPTPQRSASKV